MAGRDGPAADPTEQHVTFTRCIPEAGILAVGEVFIDWFGQTRPVQPIRRDHAGNSMRSLAGPIEEPLADRFVAGFASCIGVDEHARAVDS